MKCRVISNQQINCCYYKLILAGAETASMAEAGQFVMLRVNNGYDPLLRRPFAIHRYCRLSGQFEIMYQVVGRGTALMSQIPAGGQVDVLGPLGNGFRVPETAEAKFILVGGAIGVAPLLALAEDLIKNRGFDPGQLAVIIGGKSRTDILALSDFAALGIDVQVTTEDGSLGRAGLVTNPLADILQRDINRAVFACGPTGMLKAVAKLSREQSAPCQLSLEALMACGVGACQGCVIKTKDGDGFAYRRVCHEGPVFDANEIVW